MSKKQLRIYAAKAIASDEKTFYNFHYIKRLSEKYDIIYDPINPQYVIDNCNGSEYLGYECVRIVLSGENLRVDFNLVDYACGFDFMDFGDRYARVPLFYTIFAPQMYDGIRAQREALRLGLLESRESSEILKGRDKFCCILVSNGGRNRILFRNLAFEKISAYKRVDSGGGWNNNVGYRVGNKPQWLSGYKFNICFENSSYPGYLSEKLYEAYMAGCVPIYWGDTSLRCGVDSKDLDSVESNFMESNLMDSKNIESNLQTPPFMQPQSDKIKPNELINTQIPRISKNLFEYKINPKAFINAHNYANLDSMLEAIKRIDNDKNAYLQMLSEPLFLDNFEPFSYYENKLYNFLDSIFCQEYELAFRRGNSAMGYLYNKRAQNYYKLTKLRNKIFHYPRNTMRRIKGKF